MEDKQFNWELPDLPKDPNPRKGMLAQVTLPVKVVFEWRTDIVADVDDNGDVCEYTEGWVMNVLPEQVIFNNQEFLALGFTIPEK